MEVSYKNRTMPVDIKEEINEEIDKDWSKSDLSEYPDFICRRVNRDNQGEVKKYFEHKIRDMKKMAGGEDGEDDGLEWYGKVSKLTLLSGLFIAYMGPDREYEYIDDIFIYNGLLNKKEKATRFDRAILSEIAFVEQHISCENQSKLKEEIIGDDAFNEEDLDSWSPWTPPFREYWRRWQMLQKRGKTPCDGYRENTEGEDRLKVIAVVSLKGGVGKSIISNSIAKYAHEEGSRTAIIDLDASGPSTQFTFDVPGVRHRVASDAFQARTNSNKLPKEAWTYPSWADLFLPKGKNNGGGVPEALMKNKEEREKGQLRYFLMPDSPIYGAEVKASEGTVGNVMNVQDNLGETLNDLKNEGTDITIIDFHPGLSGGNGSILQYLDSKFDTSVICITSPRASDLAGTMTELADLYGMGEYENGPKLFINKWPLRSVSLNENEKYSEYIKSDFLENMDTLTKEIISSDLDKMTSGDLIYTWRLWSYLYIKLNIKKRECDRMTTSNRWEKFRLCVLPEDKTLKLAMNPPLRKEKKSIGRHVKINWDNGDGIKSTRWYSLLTDFIDDEVFV